MNSMIAPVTGLNANLSWGIWTGPGLTAGERLPSFTTMTEEQVAREPLPGIDTFSMAHDLAYQEAQDNFVEALTRGDPPHRAYAAYQREMAIADEVAAAGFASVSSETNPWAMALQAGGISLFSVTPAARRILADEAEKPGAFQDRLDARGFNRAALDSAREQFDLDRENRVPDAAERFERALSTGNGLLSDASGVAPVILQAVEFQPSFVVEVGAGVVLSGDWNTCEQAVLRHGRGPIPNSKPIIHCNHPAGPTSF